MLCARGAFWPGSTPEYDDYGGEYGPYDQEQDEGLFFPASTQSAAAESHSMMQARSQGDQRRFGAQLGSGLGVQPCINCSHILPSGRSTTLGVGSTSAKQCVCSPGEHSCPVAGHRHTSSPRSHSSYCTSASAICATQPDSSTHMYAVTVCVLCSDCLYTAAQHCMQSGWCLSFSWQRQHAAAAAALLCCRALWKVLPPCPAWHLEVRCTPVLAWPCMAATNQLTLLSCLSHVQPWGQPGGPKV